MRRAAEAVSRRVDAGGLGDQSLLCAQKFIAVLRKVSDKEMRLESLYEGRDSVSIGMDAYIKGCAWDICTVP